MRSASLKAVYEEARKDRRIVFIGSDLGAGTMKEFARDMPDRFFMEGVSEAHIVGMAAGLAMEGLVPYVNTIATFITRRCFEQCVLDLGLHNVNVRLIGNGGGVVYAPLGPTHEAIDDLAIMRTIPNMAVVAVCDAEEMKRLIPQTVSWRGPMYIRLARGGDPVVSRPDLPFEIGKAIRMRDGGDALIVTTGIGAQIALAAADELSRRSIEATVLHCHTVKPLDARAITEHAARSPVVVTVEEHSVVGGLGSAVAEVLAESEGIGRTKFKRIGLPDAFPSGYGSQSTLLAKYNVTPQAVTATVESLCLTSHTAVASAR
jgi:transketolase